MVDRKILYILNSGEFFLSHRISLARKAREDGYEVHVAVPKGERNREIQSLGFQVHEISLLRKSLNPFHEARSIISIWKVINRAKPDIIHNLTIKPVLYGTLVSYYSKHYNVVNTITGLGHVFMNNGARANLLRRAILSLYKCIFRFKRPWVIFQNTDDRKLFVDHCITDCERSMLIRGSGVDVRQYSPGDASMNEEIPIVLLAGRMLRQKGIEEFAGAANILRQRQVKARFVLVGALDEQNPSAISQEQLDEWNRSRCLEWWGRRENMVDIIRQSTVVCLPSYREGVPRILIEAAACEKPIVATDVPGCREIVRPNINGLLVEPKKVVPLADAIQKLIGDSELRRKMGMQGRDIVIREFADEIVNRNTMGVYLECMAL